MKLVPWTNPWTEETGRLQSMGSQRVVLVLATSTFAFIYIYESESCSVASDSL